MATRCGRACAVSYFSWPATHGSIPQRFSVSRAAAALLATTFVLFALGNVAGMAQEPAVSGDGSAEQRLRSRLASGEFAPALQQALDVSRGPQRDELLATIAAAQADSGIVDGFVATLSKIDSDVIRGRVVQNNPLDVLAQFNNAQVNDPFGPGGNAPGNQTVPAGNQGNQGQPGGLFTGTGNSGGGSEANFEELIELIISTVEPQTWEDVGGPGSVKEFAGGVHVDVDGMLTRLEAVEQGGRLDRLRLVARVGTPNRESDRCVRTSSVLRKVSLNRLEKAVQLKLASGGRVDETMHTLAGLQRVQYVLVYPETGDLVLAGPAGDWHIDQAGRRVSTETGRPVVELDDLVVILRHLRSIAGAEFGCSITPRSAGLARAKAFVEASSGKPIKAGGRSDWLAALQSQLGQQDVDTYGIAGDTRVARILVEADYHMKLIGIGLAEGTHNVPSYLELISIPKGGTPPPMDVLRWWFTLNYDALLTTPEHLAFELRGQAVQLLSENELLTAQGQRVHTGASEPLNREFARNFTDHFDDLSAIYPVYAELQNVFDLALAAALIVQQGLAERVDWHMTCFSDPQQYVPGRGMAPTSVESVINHRVIDRKHFVAAVSGGVSVSPWASVAEDSIEIDPDGHLGSAYERSQLEHLKDDAWWWD